MVSVYSMDSCHVDNPELYYCICVHPPPQKSLNSPPVDDMRYISLLLCPLPCFYPWLPSRLGSSLFFPQRSGCSKLSNKECYLLILGHLQGGCWCSSHYAFEEMACVKPVLQVSFQGLHVCQPVFFNCLCHNYVGLNLSNKGYIQESVVRVMKGDYDFCREAGRKLIYINMCPLSSGSCALHLHSSCHFIPGMAEMALIAQSQTPWPSGSA